MAKGGSDQFTGVSPCCVVGVDAWGCTEDKVWPAGFVDVGVPTGVERRVDGREGRDDLTAPGAGESFDSLGGMA